VSYNGFATVDSERAFLHLLKKANVDANWAWDQTMHAIIMDPLYKALSTLAEKWQKVIAIRLSGPVFNNIGPAPYDTPMA